MSAPASRHLCADDERQPLRGETLGDERGKAVLENRHLTLAQAGDPLGVDVGTHDLVPEMGQAGRSGQADITGSHHRDRHAASTIRLRPPALDRPCD